MSTSNSPTQASIDRRREILDLAFELAGLMAEADDVLTEAFEPNEGSVHEIFSDREPEIDTLIGAIPFAAGILPTTFGPVMAPAFASTADEFELATKALFATEPRLKQLDWIGDKMYLLIERESRQFTVSLERAEARTVGSQDAAQAWHQSVLIVVSDGTGSSIEIPLSYDFPSKTVALSSLAGDPRDWTAELYSLR